jgi:hypothetical protein
MNRYDVLLGFACMLGAIGSAPAQAAEGCALLTQAEAAAVLGAPVKPGEPAIYGCQWAQTGGQGYVQVEVAGQRYYQPPSKTAKMVPGIGLEAYTYTELGSPHAMAKTQKSVVAVWASGDKVSSEKIVDLLRKVVDRVQ